MVKILWQLLFNFGENFFKDNSREKLIIIFTFVIALCILFSLGKEGLELIGVIVGGYFSFLKGEKRSETIIKPQEEISEKKD